MEIRPPTQLQKTRRIGGYFTFGVSPTITALVANTLYAAPFIVSKLGGETFDRIAVEITGGGGAGTKLRAGIYKDPRDDTAYPSTLILDSGEIDANTVAVVEVVINQKLPQGVYWLAIISDGTPTMRSISISNAYDIIGAASTLGNTSVKCWGVARAYGALPDPYTAAGTVNGNAIGIWLRKSA